MKVYVQDEDRARVLLHTRSPKSERFILTELTREEAIGVAARLLECALRIDPGARP